MTSPEARDLHTQARHVDPDHDQVTCWCCCLDCDFDAAAVWAADEAKIRTYRQGHTAVSWNIYLHDDRGHLEFETNYTHNTNGMISAALVSAGGDAPAQCGGPLGPAIGPAWWHNLNGLTGYDGQQYLDRIITGLHSDPERFRAMNPNNGWGDYDSLLDVLTRAREAVPDYPTTWSASG